MPVQAVRRFYTEFRGDSGFDPARQLQCLVDTPARLDQYRTLARTLGVKMRFNLEIDVGLHRGGIASPEVFGRMVRTILADPKHLEFAGLMGYDPHVVKIPGILKSRDRAYAESQGSYRQFIDTLKADFPGIPVERLCFNGAGSPTIALHKSETVINDMSAGSCLVKPVDFDIPTLADFQPATYIVAPVLKKLPGTTLPAAEAARDLFGWWDPNQQQTFFMYGGKWMAHYESPPGLQANALYGHSTNQQMVNGSRRVPLEVDDHIFLRPNQSEFVFLQFGDLLAVRGGRIVDRWAILKQ
jgi:D-serine deaminase-like pyridoxal phosphate-dependent protein